MKIVQKKISELKPAGYNPRAMTKDERDALKRSIEQFEFVEPVIINVNPKRRNVIIGGHQRVDVAKEMGLQEVPCVELNLTPAKERELNIRLNKNLGHWNYEALRQYFDVNDLLAWGFERKELDLDANALIRKREPTHPSELKEAIDVLVRTRLQDLIALAEGLAGCCTKIPKLLHYDQRLADAKAALERALGPIEREPEEE